MSASHNFRLSGSFVLVFFLTEANLGPSQWYNNYKYGVGVDRNRYYLSTVSKICN